MTDETRVKLNMLRIEKVKLLLTGIGFWEWRKAKAQKARLAEIEAAIAALEERKLQ